MDSKKYAWFIAFLVIAQIFGLGMIAMVVMWMSVYQEVLYKYS